MRSKRDWQALTSFGRHKSSGKYHRLDIEFDGPEPRLDGVGDMPSLQSIALENSSISSVLDNIARCAIASSHSAIRVVSSGSFADQKEGLTISST